MESSHDAELRAILNYLLGGGGKPAKEEAQVLYEIAQRTSMIFLASDDPLLWLEGIKVLIDGLKDPSRSHEGRMLRLLLMATENS